MFVLGYERVDQDLQVLDVLLRKKEDGYKLVLPQLPGGNINSDELSFIGIDQFRKNPESKEKVRIDLFKINSEGRKYILAKLSEMRRNVVFRLIEAQEDDFIVRCHINSITTGYEHSGEVPKVVVKENGKMDLEEERMIRHFYKKVSVQQVTPLIGGDFEDWDTLREQVDNGLNADIIKEAGDSEIGLAVITEKDNV